MAETRRRWFRFRLRTLLLAILIVAIAASLYSYWSDYQRVLERRARESLSPTRGALCEVVLQRELLGLEEMSPDAVTHNGVSNYVRGRFRGMNADWIVLEGRSGDAAEQWIPRQHVMLLRVLE